MSAVVVFVLEAYAIGLAWLHALAGVQTDEAKYLLNIPYPHPPLLRSIMGATASWPLQEMLWRVLLATLVVQAVWFVWDMARGLPRYARIAVCAVWLLSPSVLLQGGTVMFGPVTAVTALVMLWLLLRQKQGMHLAPETWGLLWAVALLVAYQGVTVLPLVVAGAWRSDGPVFRKAAAVVLPLILVSLVTLTNPLAVATMIIHADEGARMTFAEHAQGAAVLWITAGAWIASLLGTLGLLVRPRWEVLGAFGLTCLFVLGSAPFPFYGILFLPFLVEGVRNAFIAFPRKLRAIPLTFIACFIAGGLWLQPWDRISTDPSPARTVMWSLGSDLSEGTIAIAGSFGHQWSYESPLPVVRYVPGKLDGVSAIVCLNDCDIPAGWNATYYEGIGITAWTR